MSRPKQLIVLICSLGLLFVVLAALSITSSVSPQIQSVGATSVSPLHSKLPVAAPPVHRINLPLVIDSRESYYVAPNGTADGDGSSAHPWDLATALSQPRVVQPGAMIWLRKGVYKGEFTSTLTGTKSAPIVVRQYPHERAVIDGSLSIKGAWSTYWGFTVTRTDSINTLRLGVTLFGPHITCINLVVYQVQGSGFGIWQEAPDSEVYGSVIFNNGANRFDHGIYAQNHDGYKLIEDNIIFNQSGYGIHAYTSKGENDRLNNITVTGNIIFNNGFSSPYAANLLVGGETPARNITVDRNYTYYSDQVHWNVDVGFGDPTNDDLTMTNNYFAGGNWILQIRDWKQVKMTGNTLVGPNRLIWFRLPDGSQLPPFDWNSNIYTATEVIPPFLLREKELSYSEWRQATGFDMNSLYTQGEPTGPKIVVRPNRYEPGRANIVVYNWARQPTIDVDLSGVVQSGKHFVVHNVLDYFGKPVAEGMYKGGAVTLPMAGTQPAVSTVSWAKTPVATGPEFNVFVVTSE